MKETVEIFICCLKRKSSYFGYDFFVSGNWTFAFHFPGLRMDPETGGSGGEDLLLTRLILDVEAVDLP
jgi:hypothetical protein